MGQPKQVDHVSYFEVAELTNLTTEMSMLKPDKSGRVPKIEAIEFDDSLVGLEVDSKTCARGHLITLDGTVYMGPTASAFSAVGKIIEKIELTDSRAKVRIEFHSFNKDLWWSFISLQRGRQAHADQVFYSIKDED